MADKFLDMSIEWDGLDELKKYFKKMDERFVDIALDELQRFGIKVEEVMRLLAPRDSGDLEESIKAGIPSVKNQAFEMIVGTPIEYALAVHEKPYTQGTRPKYQKGVKYPDYYENGRGRNTRIKSNFRGFVPGRKFMQNGVTATEKEWSECLQRILERTIQEGLR